MEFGGEHLSCARDAEESGVEMAEGEICVVLFALNTSAKVRIGVTMCAPSGRAMNGRRCHDSGIGTGEVFVGLAVVVVDVDAKVAEFVFVVVSGERGGYTYSTSGPRA